MTQEDDPGGPVEQGPPQPPPTPVPPVAPSGPDWVHGNFVGAPLVGRMPQAVADDAAEVAAEHAAQEAARVAAESSQSDQARIEAEK
jgi:hypothetical protein